MMRKLGYMSLLLSTCLIVSAGNCDEDKDELDLFAKSTIFIMARVHEIDKNVIRVRVIKYLKGPVDLEPVDELMFLADPECHQYITEGKTFYFFLKARSHDQNFPYESINQKEIERKDMTKLKRNCNYLKSCSPGSCSRTRPTNCEWSEFDEESKHFGKDSEDGHWNENQNKNEAKKTNINKENHDDKSKSTPKTGGIMEHFVTSPLPKVEANDDNEKNTSPTLSTINAYIITAATMLLLLLY